LIAYFIGNISAKKNIKVRSHVSRVIASQRWDVFLRHGVFENNSYAHDDQGNNPVQATECLTVSSIKCDCCWHLD